MSIELVVHITNVFCVEFWAQVLWSVLFLFVVLL